MLVLRDHPVPNHREVEPSPRKSGSAPGALAINVGGLGGRHRPPSASPQVVGAPGTVFWLRSKVTSSGFLRVVGASPPLFAAGEGRIDLDAAVDAFEGVKERPRYSDLTLAASVKRPAVIRFDRVHAAALLQKKLQVDSAPVVLSRDQNRPQPLPSALAGMQA
ncbi:MAG: hypothetical protein JRN11_06860 [Nitrososphaerota archaeon]|nr:hypothetical protein [Nitrososphaerota archaeon]MDG7026448.1 hypothetical protein [Nitrososphaerota archaeon]